MADEFRIFARKAKHFDFEWFQIHQKFPGPIAQFPVAYCEMLQIQMGVFEGMDLDALREEAQGLHDFAAAILAAFDKPIVLYTEDDDGSVHLVPMDEKTGERTLF